MAANEPLKIFFNDGCGVESFATVLRWHLDPDSRFFILNGRKVRFDWEQVVAITSQTGGEDELTKYLNEEYKLPIYRERNVRYVQVARAGPLEADGIVVLDDTRQPDTLYIEGAYTLAQELKTSGVVPAYAGGVHTCSQKYKGWVVETFVDYDLHQPKLCSRTEGEGYICSSCAEHILTGRADAATKRRSRKKQSDPRQARFDALELFTEAASQVAPSVLNITPVFRAFGYNSTEQSRITDSDKAFREYNQKNWGITTPNTINAPAITNADDLHIRNLTDNAYCVVFGFNVNESSRIREAKKFDVLPRIGIYPLDLWSWTREDCLNYIQQHLGIRFVRSRCSFCPFNALTSEDIQRHLTYPNKLFDALLIEFVALAMNPRSTLYKKHSLYELAVEHDMRDGLRLFDEHISTCEWSFYRVRRIYYPKKGVITKKGRTDRAVEKLATGTRQQMMREFRARTRNLMVEHHHNHAYGYVRHRSEILFPSSEEYYVACPSTVATKARTTIEAFDEKWNALLGFDPRRPRLTDPTATTLQN